MFDRLRAEDSAVGVFRKRVVTVEGAEVASPHVVPPHEKFGNPFIKRDRTCAPGVRCFTAQVIVFASLRDRVDQHPEDLVEAHVVVEDSIFDHALELFVVISQRLEIGSVFPAVRIRHDLSDYQWQQRVVVSCVDRAHERRLR